MDPIIIPVNYTDAGKILGYFNLRNVLEAAVFGIPGIFLMFLLPFGLMTNIIAGAVAVVPLCGFSLIGINDYSLLQFLRLYHNWRRSRRIVTYRGTTWQKTKRK